MVIPGDIDQSWIWLKKLMLGMDNIHLIGVSATCLAIWKARNTIMVKDVMIKSLNEVLCQVCALMIHRVGLSKKDLQDLMQESAKLLLRAVSAKLENMVDEQEEDNDEELGRNQGGRQ
jgi:hypothetical protein